MNILWDDSVYPLIKVSQTAKSPFELSEAFITAVKSTIEKRFPTQLVKNDGSKTLVIEKDTAIMGDVFFAHVDSVSRRLFDLTAIETRFQKTSTSIHSMAA